MGEIGKELASKIQKKTVSVVIDVIQRVPSHRLFGVAYRVGPRTDVYMGMGFSKQERFYYGEGALSYAEVLWIRYLET